MQRVKIAELNDQVWLTEQYVTRDLPVWMITEFLGMKVNQVEKALSKFRFGDKFTANYNGDGSIRVLQNIKPSKKTHVGELIALLKHFRC